MGIQDSKTVYAKDNWAFCRDSATALIEMQDPCLFGSSHNTLRGVCVYVYVYY